MRCDEIRGRLLAAEHLLPDGESAAHLGGCPACTAFLHALEGDQEALGAALEAPVAMPAAAAWAPARARRLEAPWRLLALAGAAALLLIWRAQTPSSRVELAGVPPAEDPAEAPVEAPPEAPVDVTAELPADAPVEAPSRRQAADPSADVDRRLRVVRDRVFAALAAARDAASDAAPNAGSDTALAATFATARDAATEAARNAGSGTAFTAGLASAFAAASDAAPAAGGDRLPWATAHLSAPRRAPLRVDPEPWPLWRLQILVSAAPRSPENPFTEARWAQNPMRRSAEQRLASAAENWRM